MRSEDRESRQDARRGLAARRVTNRPRGPGAFRLVPLAAPLLFLLACGEEPPPPPPAAVHVKAAEVVARDVPIYVEAVGETRGNTEIEIRPRVEGYLQSVAFTEGTFVRKGQPLYTIDPSPLESKAAEARARLAVAEADLARASQDVARYKPLVAKNAISRQVYETAVAVEQAQKSGVEAARASLRSAQIDLGYTRIAAPDDGLVGKTEVHPGTLVGPGQNSLLTRISKVDPIHARFTIPERDYLRLARDSQQRGPTGTAAQNFELILADGSVHPQPGKLVFVDRNVDPRTGTILLEAAFPNPGGVVRPGQYGRVRAAIEVKHGAVVVPQRAVQELQGLYNVAVVGKDDTIEIRPVRIGERVGSQWVVEQGLTAGERIVVDGLQKVRPGSKVEAELVSIDAGPPPTATATGT